jgi:hypothetical protein
MCLYFCTACARLGLGEEEATTAEMVVAAEMVAAAEVWLSRQ